LPFGVPILVIAAFILWKLLPRAHRTEVDVNSGRLRHRRAVCGVIFQESVEETNFSRLVAENNLAATPPDWRPAWSHISGVHVDHTHGFAESFCEMAVLSPYFKRLSGEDKRTCLADLLSLLREGREVSIETLEEQLHPEGEPLP
jgi:hypothetical protein